MGEVRRAWVTPAATAAHRRRLLAASPALLALVLALWAWLRTVGPLPGERGIARAWEQGHPAQTLLSVPDLVVEFFGDLATPIVALATVLVLAAIFDRHLGRGWALLVVAASGVVVLNAALKLLFGPSPLWVELHNSGSNFPSGHVAYATSVFGLVGIVALGRGWRAAAAACAALIVLMGPARVIGETHLPSDAIAGYAVGGAWLCALLAVGVPWAERLGP